MNTIQAYENDLFLQLDFLKKFQKQKKLSPSQQKNSIFTGSGDSLVSAMLAEAFSNFIVRAIDPLDLLKNKTLVHGKKVYFVSISGNTVSNIKVSRISDKSIAITSQPNSRLANYCDKTIILSSPNSDVFTAGSISFLDSALTCISLVTNLKIPKPDNIFNKAKTDAKKSKFGKRIFVLGNAYTYPLAMYCAAKFYEILGLDAHYEKIEQFSHMELFSTKKDDTIIIFEEKNKHNQHLSENLKKVGLKVIHPHLDSTDKVSQILYYIFYSQFLPLFVAKYQKQKDCNFVIAKKLRKVSDNMIY